MEVVDIRYIGKDGQYQTYSPSDVALINTSLITANFGAPTDYVEYFIKDVEDVVLSSNYYSSKYTIGDVVNPIDGTTTQLYLDPQGDAEFSGYTRGVFNVKYNFLSQQLNSAPDPLRNFWIKEISVSRTEVKAARQDLSNSALQQAFDDFNTVLTADTYYPTFYLNFGNDNLVIGVNAVYVEEGGDGYVIFKLYDPLPEQFELKSTFWVVTQVADSAAFNLTINVTPEKILGYRPIKGPNFKISVNDRVNQTTPYYTYASLFATSITSSYQQLQSLMAEKGIQINVDYGSFNNFVHFSSATERLYNFTYKLQLIESASLGLVSTNTATAKVLLQSQIDSIITNFDGYEYYLYFNSASTAWPKQNSNSPYVLYSVTSSQARNWLGSPTLVPTSTTMSMYWSSSYYDDQNKDMLTYATPSYILDDAANTPYLVFLNMIGQHFDNIWIYLKDVTNRYSAENNPFVGISMDQVSEALQSFGVQLYTNTSVTDNLYYSMLGLNQTGSTLPVTSSAFSTTVYASSSIYPLAGQPYLSASIFLPPFGKEKLNRYVLTFPSASTTTTASFQSLSNTQITDEIYKRLYHNLAYLLKTRGTERGVKALIATYGIPNDILTVHEYGGYNIYEVPGIQEISNIRIISSSVDQMSSSLLTPYTTVQYYNNDLQKTSGNVQVGFSPADSINASITSSGFITSSTQPGYFNIMQYIGAPDLQYSSSYIPLVNVSNAFFSQSFTGNPVTGQNRYNVWDFMRIIKYYNNSLFKMLKDWVPARVSPETGIVIKPHILERNKYARHEPTGLTSSYDADYLLLTVTGSDGGAIVGNTNYVQIIPVQYSAYSTPLTQSSGYVYVSSSDDVQKYNGEFSGSYIVAATNYFPQTELSSYAYPWSSSVAPSLHGGNAIMFLTYSISPIFQNVTGAVLSQRYLDLDYNQTQFAATNYGLVTQSLQRTLVIGSVSQSVQPYSQYAQLQDFNYFSRPSVMSRYSGSYLIGLQYNTYSVGDVSYGKSPVIDYYSSKLGFFSQVFTSSFLPGKVNATLPYLADVSGGLFELNQNNKNWADVQNIFKAGTTLTVKQFDPKQYSNQVSTDGVKTIYNSGYNYSPQLYYVSGTDTKLYFQYLGSSTVSSFQAYNTLVPDAYISGAGYPAYPVTMSDSTLRSGNVYRIFNAANPTTNYTASSYTAFPTYSIQEAGQKTFTVSLPVNFQFQNPATNPVASGSYSFGIYNGTTLVGTLQTVNFTSSYTAGGYTNGTIDKRSYDANPDFGSVTPLASTTVATGPFTLTIDGSSPSTIGTAASWISASAYSYTENGGLNYFANLLVEATSVDISANFNTYSSATPTVLLAQPTSATATSPSSIFTATRTISYTTPATSFSQGDQVGFRFRQEGMSTSNFTSSIGAGSLTVSTISTGLGGYPYATASLGNFISSISNVSNVQSQIQFSQNLTQYVGYLFVPYFMSGSTEVSSSLYSRYGDINYAFAPQPGDKLVLIDASSVVQEVDVYTTGSTNGNLTLNVVPNVLDNWVINPKLIVTVLILRRYKDEQNVIMTFNKLPGATSYGFLLPETVSPAVTNNINTLQAAVQSQLLSMQYAPPGVNP